MKKLIPLALLLGAAYLAWLEITPPVTAPLPSVQIHEHAAPGFVAPRNGQQTRGTGTVTRILPDDNEGSRHQRFIVEVGGNRTLLIAHNIDLAPRIESLKAGDSVEFYGEYESNDRGGLIHWTHHDPKGRHVDGWLKHGGRTYQ